MKKGRSVTATSKRHFDQSVNCHVLRASCRKTCSGTTNFGAQIVTAAGVRSEGRSCRACGVRLRACPGPDAPA